MATKPLKRHDTRDAAIAQARAMYQRQRRHIVSLTARDGAVSFVVCPFGQDYRALRTARIGEACKIAYTVCPDDFEWEGE